MRHMLLALTAALVGAVPAQAQVWEQVFPLQEMEAFAVEYEGVAVKITPPPPYPEGVEVSEEEHAATYADARITVRFPGLPPYEVPKDEYRSTPYGISIGIGRMALGDAVPAVLLGGYSGGMHCCATLQVISVVDGAPVSALMPLKDGEPLDAFPADIDGDGTRDFDWIDQSLLYAFTSYAGSWPVPRIYNLRGGEPVDVSREPRYAEKFRDFAAKALAECRVDDSESAGPCAAYAYAMALRGKAEEGIRTAVENAEPPPWYPHDCLVEYVDDQCPEGQERTFAGFEDALRWIMRQHGYLPPEAD